MENLTEKLKGYITKHSNDLCSDGRTLQDWINSYLVKLDNPINEWNEFVCSHPKIKVGFNGSVNDKTLKELDKCIKNQLNSIDLTPLVYECYYHSIIEFLTLVSKIHIGKFNTSHVRLAAGYPFIKVEFHHAMSGDSYLRSITYKLSYNFDIEGYESLFLFSSLRDKLHLASPRILHEPEKNIGNFNLNLLNKDSFLLFLLCTNCKTMEDFAELHNLISSR